MDTLGGLGSDCLHVGMPAQVIRQGGAQFLGGFDDLNGIAVDMMIRGRSSGCRLKLILISFDHLGWIDLHPMVEHHSLI